MAIYKIKRVKLTVTGDCQQPLSLLLALLVSHSDDQSLLAHGHYHEIGSNAKEVKVIFASGVGNRTAYGLYLSHDSSKIYVSNKTFEPLIDAIHIKYRADESVSKTLRYCAGDNAIFYSDFLHALITNVRTPGLPLYSNLNTIDVGVCMIDIDPALIPVLPLFARYWNPESNEITKYTKSITRLTEIRIH